MKIAITGATGQLGRLTIEKLKEKTSKDNLIALVRNPEKAKDLGIETRAFDYNDPETLANSLKGVDSLFLISSNEIGQRETQHKNVINAAKENGVKWIVYTSLLNASTSKMTLVEEHIPTEKAIKESGISYTILRNGWYTENYASSIPTAIENGSFIGCAENGKISSAAREDYAEAAAIVLTTNGHENKIYELAGDEAYTLTDFVAEISKKTGKEISYKNLSEADYAKALIKIGVPENFAKVFADSDAKAAHGALFSEDKTLSNLLNRPTTKMSEIVEKFI